jgi:O-antigen ligase
MMIYRTWQQTRSAQAAVRLAQIAAVLSLTAILSWWFATTTNRMATITVALITGAILAAIIWFKPHVGLFITIASLPLQSILKGIPLGNLLITVLGGFALIAFVYQRKGRKLFSYGLRPQFVLAGGFVLWQFLTYPSTSFYGDRNWLFTFMQLWVMMWLASELITPERQLWMLRLYIIACVISAVDAFSTSNIVADFSGGSGLVRSEGLADNQNALAFYLVTGLLFTTLLHRQDRHWWAAFVYVPVYAALMLGVVGTVSRTGFLMIGITLVMIVAFWLINDRHRITALIAPLIALIVAGLYFIPADYWTVMETTIFSPERDAAGNFGNRNALIDAGIEVWQDYPVAGVGINQYREVSRDYLSFENARVFGKLPHNLYVTLLAETGLVGFLLFMGWIGYSMWELFMAWRYKVGWVSSLALIWLFTTLLALFRAYTASTLHYDKLMWMMGGMAIVIYQTALAQQRALAHETT